MTDLRTAAQQFVTDYENGDLGDLKHYARALRAALEQDQKPVAWMLKSGQGTYFKETLDPKYQALEWVGRKMWVPLYEHPPHRETEQEPVARVIDDETPEGSTEWIPYSKRQTPVKTGDLLYTHPPRHHWQGLSEEEISELSRTMVKGDKSVNWLARAIETALKEKNQ